ncbi:MAG: SUMF1/EgtB/PvdO family nonheme iron enzyme [bacterium]
MIKKNHKPVCNWWVWILPFLVSSSAHAGWNKPSFPASVGKSWAVLVGIDRYKRWPGLEFPGNDSKTLYRILRHKGFKPVILTGSQASNKEIKWTLEKELRTRAQKNDQVLLFFATRVKSALNRAYGSVQNHFISYDTDLFLTGATSVAQEYLIDQLKSLPAERIMIIADNCYYLNLTALQHSLDAIPEKSIYWISAGKKEERMQQKDGASVFLKTIGNALSGSADDNHDGLVSGKEFIKYIGKNLPRKTGGKQHPQTVISDKGKGYYFETGRKTAGTGKKENVKYLSLWEEEPHNAITVSKKKTVKTKPVATAALEIISDLKDTKVYLDYKPLGKITRKLKVADAPLDLERIGIINLTAKAGVGSRRLKLIHRRQDGIYFEHSRHIEINKHGKNRFVINKKSFKELEPPPGMVLVPAGLFTMGSKKGKRNEQPAHPIFLDSYYIDKYEVTNSEFREFVRATGYRTDAERRGYGWVYLVSWEKRPEADWRHPFGPRSTIENQDDLPVVQVSWNDARSYAQWAGKRLPTEAQWEKAAKGTGFRVWPWGNIFGRKKANTAGEADRFSQLAPAGSFSRTKSVYGTFDQAGNVWEWCSDWYFPDYYRSSPYANPQGPASGREKIMRGGSWREREINARVSVRQKGRPRGATNDTGFRCVINVN